LRSLEEFRKNPHVQIPSKSPCKISQILAKILIHFKFKNQYFFPLNLLAGSSPAGPVRPC
jgi:hypothetical protein